MGKLRKIGKKIVKGIKTGLKSIGKAFKSAFKGIGKFIGKLGPIGMLGMMLIMPQMASWWGSFGKWAGTLGKGFGTVMRGVHKAGTMLGKAYSTVTETIGKTLNVATGGTFSTAGTLGYEAGYSDQLANWMSSTMDSAREGLGLETAGGGVPSAEVDVDIPTDVPTDVSTTVSPETTTVSSGYNPQDQQLVDQIQTYDSKGLTNMSTNLKSQLSPDGLNMYNDYGAEGYIDDFTSMEGYDKVIKPGEDLSNRIVKGITGEPSTWDKVKKVGTVAYTGATTVKSGLEDWGLLDEDIGSGYAGLGPAEAAVDTQLRAEDDWAAMGMSGPLLWGNTVALFNSIYGDASNTG